MDEGISRELHDEFAARMQSENDAIRQELRTVQSDTERRLATLEASVTEIHQMSKNVASLAENMSSVNQLVHEQRSDIREMRDRLEQVNAEHIMHRLDDQDSKLAEHEERVRKLEEHRACVAGHQGILDDHSKRINAMEQAAGKTALKWLGIVGSCIITGVVGWMLANAGITG